MIKMLMILIAVLLTGCQGSYSNIAFFEDVFTFEYEMVSVSQQFDREVHEESGYVYVSPRMELGTLPNKCGYRVELYDQDALDTLFHGAGESLPKDDWERIQEYERQMYLGREEGHEAVDVAGHEGLLALSRAEDVEGLADKNYKIYSLWAKGDGCYVHVVVEGWLKRDAIDHILATWKWSE